MPRNPANAGLALPYVRRLFATGGAAGRSDAELLDRFAEDRDEGAFAALVDRHGAMVLGVCRGLLINPDDAEDAFQATFLVLARRAGSLRVAGDSLGGWLHGVARRVAVRARAERARRMARERATTRPIEAVAGDDRARLVDLMDAVHAEVARLPARCRGAVVLCDLEGRTHAQAASELGRGEATVRRRLAEGRDLLRARLGRRGLAPAATLAVLLDSARADAAVPATLASATSRAARCLALGRGAVGASAAATALAGAALRAAGVARVALAGSAAVAAGACLAWLAAVDGPGVFARVEGPGVSAVGPASAAAPTRDAVPARTSGDDDRADEDHVPIAGRVVDADGLPVAGARVAIAVRSLAGRLQAAEVIGSAATDGDGRYRLEVPATSSTRHYELVAVASAQGFGIAAAALDPDADRHEATLTLDAEQPVRGRLIDLEGRPVPGAVVSASGLTAGEVRLSPPSGGAGTAGLWPGPATTDADGRFALSGVDRRTALAMEAKGPGIAPQRFEIAAGAAGRDEEATHPMAPARVVDLKVARADDGTPIRGATIAIVSHPDLFSSWNPNDRVSGQTDDGGRLELVPWPGTYFEIKTDAPVGGAALPNRTDLEWADGSLRKSVEVALEPGITVRGMVTEGPNGAPVPGARLAYVQTYIDNPSYLYDLEDPVAASGPDGSFAIVVPRGPGHLLVGGPTPDYLHEETSPGALRSGRRPNFRLYPDAIAAPDLPAGDGSHRVDFRLRRGAPAEGRVFGPDGEPVHRAILFGRSYLPLREDRDPFDSFGGGCPKLAVRDGRFRVPGCDPAAPLPFYVLDPKGQVGAAVELTGGSETEVRLGPCGSARVRFVDADGTPIVGRPVGMALTLVITPGASIADDEQVAADIEYQVNLDPERYRELATDAEGRCTFPTLIPGARYRLSGDDFAILLEFEAEDGGTTELPDVVIGPPASE